MAALAINFFSEDVDFSPSHGDGLRGWLLETIGTEGFEVDEISFIFCSDEHLLGINKQYLEHDHYTDVITFDYSEGKSLNADVYISIERVRDHARIYGVAEEDELHRVMVHGVLHLVGYQDKSEADKAFMRRKEDHYLAKRVFVDQNTIE